MKTKRNVLSLPTQFLRSEKGNVSMFFGFGLIPIIGMAGASIDYLTASKLKTQLQAAADSAALSLAHEARAATAAQLQTLGQNYMNGAFPLSNQATTPVVTVTGDSTNKLVTVATSSVVKGFFSRLMGKENSTIHAAATASYVLNKIEVALVLDNTGSMAQYGKMTALKTAVGNFITGLENSVISNGDAKLSVTPFNAEVQLDNIAGSAFNNTSAFANSGLIKYGTGVFDMNQYNYTTAPKVSTNQANWTGCLADRDIVTTGSGYNQVQDSNLWDATAAPAVLGNSASLYIAAPCQFTGLAKFAPLTTNLESIRTITNSMQPNGNTDIPIGYNIGLMSLNAATPFGTGASIPSGTLDPTTKITKFMVLLTDGQNTMDRYSADSNFIDARLNNLCTWAKAQTDPRDGTGKTPLVTLFTIGLEMGAGAADPAVLIPCATDSGKYYGVQNSGQIDNVFKQILNEISAIRLKS